MLNLLGRLFSYSDTHRHRLGPNHLQLPVNCPYRVSAKNYQRDGFMCFNDNQGGKCTIQCDTIRRVRPMKHLFIFSFILLGAPNYFPNSFSGPQECERARKLNPSEHVSGDVKHISSGHEDNFTQASVLYNKVFSAEQRLRLANNISGNVAAASPFIQERVVKNFTQVSVELGSRIAQNLKIKTSANL